MRAEPVPQRRLGAGRLLCLAVAGVLAVLALRHIALSVGFPYPLSYPEGVMAAWTDDLLAGESLYPRVEPEFAQRHNPYPPVPYWLTARLRPLVPNPFAAGRVLSLIGFIVAAGCIAALAKRHAGRYPAAVAALLFTLSPTVLRYACEFRADMPALAFSLMGLWLFDDKSGRSRAAAAGCFQALAVLTKPTIIALPLAGAIGVCRHDGRRGRAFAWGGLLTLALGLGAVWAGGGTGVFTHLVRLQAVPLDVEGGLGLVTEFVARHAILVAALAYGIVRGVRTRTAAWWAAALAVASLGLTLKSGAAGHYMLPSIASACLLIGPVAAGLSQGGRRRLAWLVLAQMLLYVPVAPAPVFTRTYGQELPATSAGVTPTGADRRVGRIVLAEIASVDGPVLCQEVGYLVLAGKPVTMQPFQFAQRARMGAWDDEALVTRIRRREFDMIVIKSDPRTGQSVYFTPATLAAIDRYYVLRRHVGPYRILDPGS